jgi:hypothetical protein
LLYNILSEFCSLYSIRRDSNPKSLRNLLCKLLCKKMCKSVSQGVTKICRLSWMTNSALVQYLSFEPNCGGGGCGASANEYSCAHGAPINFGDLTSYLISNWLAYLPLQKLAEASNFLRPLWAVQYAESPLSHGLGQFFARNSMTHTVRATIN